MAKMPTMEIDVVIRPLVSKAMEAAVTEAQHDAWEAGMRHALAWLGLRHYGDVMAKDNPHGSVEG